MTKISKIITAASVLGVMGLAVLPVASYAGDVIISVTIGEDSDPGTCETDGTCIGGGNSQSGYVATIKDKDGVKFNLARNTDAGVIANEGSSAVGTNTIPTIATAMANGNALDPGAGYGVRANGSLTGQAGGFDGALVHANSNIGTRWQPVSAAIGTITSDGPGLFNVAITNDVKANAGTEIGTYTNTISVIYAAVTP